MTPEQIEELFIAAAETDRRLPSSGERPATLKAQAIPYFHSQIDVQGWGGERYQQERADFLSNRTTRLRTSDVSRWELCNELMRFVPRERDRRCLWAWAMSEAKTLRLPVVEDGEMIMKRASFSRWCKDVERIHRNTGTHRKDAAVSCIVAIFVRNTLADIRKLQNTTLQNTPEISDKQVIIGADREWTWTAPDAFSSEFPKASRFNPDKVRNEQRRAREAKRRQAA